MTTVQITEATYEAILRLAGATPIDAVIAEAVEDLRRKRMLDESNAAFTALRDNPEAWEVETREQEAWDATRGDGLEESIVSQPEPLCGEV